MVEKKKKNIEEIVGSFALNDIVSRQTNDYRFNS